MARTAEQVLREVIGQQVMALAKLAADLEAAQEQTKAAQDEIARLKAAAEKP